MRVVGYTYPDGSALCVEHALDEVEPDSAFAPEEVHPVFDTDEGASDLYCDICFEPLDEAE